MKHHPKEGTLHLPTAHGGVSVGLDGANNVSVNMSLVREVGVASLAEVIKHEIVHVAGLTSHHLELVGGSKIDYAFNQFGKLVELSGFRVQGFITADHCLILRAYRG